MLKEPNWRGLENLQFFYNHLFLLFSLYIATSVPSNLLQCWNHYSNMTTIKADILKFQKKKKLINKLSVCLHQDTLISEFVYFDIDFCVCVCMHMYVYICEKEND